MSKFLPLVIFILSLFLPIQISAQEIGSTEILEGRVIIIPSSGEEKFMDELVEFQELEIELTKGDDKGEKITIKNSQASMGMVNVQFQKYQVGDNVRIIKTQLADDQVNYSIDGKVKRTGLVVLLILFILVVLAVGKVWGLLSIFGLLVSFGVIFQMVIPMIINGTNPILSAVIGSIIIIPTTFYISHGFNKKTHVGVIATFIGLIITGLLAVYFVDATHLTGFASEEAGFLQVERRGSIDIRGLLLAGIIIGTLGILDDVTIGQASTVQQLRRANKDMTVRELYQTGMNVGQDHISSMVNTLVLVYSGSALPLLLLFFGSDKGFTQIIEFELIAEEIVRMLVGSIGLVLSAPLATILAAVWFGRED